MVTEDAAANGAFDSLLQTLAIKRSGYHRAEGPRGVALFPHSAEDVARWEERCRAMHDDQVPVDVEEKPVPKFADYIRLKRGT